LKEQNRLENILKVKPAREWRNQTQGTLVQEALRIGMQNKWPLLRKRPPLLKEFTLMAGAIVFSSNKSPQEREIIEGPLSGQ